MTSLIALKANKLALFKTLLNNREMLIPNIKIIESISRDIDNRKKKTDSY